MAGEKEKDTKKESVEKKQKKVKHLTPAEKEAGFDKLKAEDQKKDQAKKEKAEKKEEKPKAKK